MLKAKMLLGKSLMRSRSAKVTMTIETMVKIMMMKITLLLMMNSNLRRDSALPKPSLILILLIMIGITNEMWIRQARLEMTTSNGTLGSSSFQASIYIPMQIH